MVLDEATANLDYATELAIKHALNTLRRDRTTLVIAHRFSMIKDADFVYVLDSGRVIEAGTPDELVVAGGWFAGFADGSGDDECISDEQGIFDADLLEDVEEEFVLSSQT